MSEEKGEIRKFAVSDLDYYFKYRSRKKTTIFKKNGKTLHNCTVICILQNEQVFLDQWEGEREAHSKCSDCQSSGVGIMTTSTSVIPVELKTTYTQIIYIYIHI